MSARRSHLSWSSPIGRTAGSVGPVARCNTFRSADTRRDTYWWGDACHHGLCACSGVTPRAVMGVLFLGRAGRAAGEEALLGGPHVMWAANFAAFEESFDKSSEGPRLVLLLSSDLIHLSGGASRSNNSATQFGNLRSGTGWSGSRCFATTGIHQFITRSGESRPARAAVWDPQHLVAQNFASLLGKPRATKARLLHHRGFFWDDAILYAPHSKWRQTTTGLFSGTARSSACFCLEKALQNRPYARPQDCVADRVESVLPASVHDADDLRRTKISGVPGV